MRIEAYNAVSQIYQSNTRMTNKTAPNKGVNDQFEISQTAKNYQVAKQAVSSAPDIREDKVAEIKAKMASGTYSVTAQDFAEKVLSDSSTLSF